MKVWERPKLVVLERGAPQEYVLATCKFSTGKPNGSGTVGSGCAGKNDACEQCSITGGS